MRLSLAWAERSKRAFEQSAAGAGAVRHRAGRRRSGIADDERARRWSISAFHGYAIGGLAVGEPQAVMLRMIEEVTPVLPADRPRYLMGVGTPDDLIEAVARGIDMFDCVMPTRNGRHGLAFTRFGPITLKNARHADDPRPLDEAEQLPARRAHYSRAYLHHLVKANEMLGAILLTTINLAYYQELMAGMRAAIATGAVRGFPRGNARRLGARRHLDQLKNSVEEPSTAYLVRHR